MPSNIFMKIKVCKYGCDTNNRTVDTGPLIKLQTFVRGLPRAGWAPLAGASRGRSSPAQQGLPG